MTQRGRLIILSGPSGAGKSTVLRELIDKCDLPLQLSVSATTRKPRPGEQDGVDYHFLSLEQFQEMRAAGNFLECMEVFGRGDWYGTPANKVEQVIASGKWVILEIDVQGALTVMKKCQDALSFFVHPGTVSELETRLRKRGTDDEAAIQRRLEVAEEELTFLSYYKHEIINREVATSVEEICQILKSVGKGDSCLKN